MNAHPAEKNSAVALKVISAYRSCRMLNASVIAIGVSARAIVGDSKSVIVNAMQMQVVVRCFVALSPMRTASTVLPAARSDIKSGSSNTSNIAS